MSEEETKDKGFKVEDKRRFTAEGESKSSPTEKLGEGAEPAKQPKEPTPPLPPIDFNTFILSLASSVQVHLGFLPDPVEGRTSKNFDLAKQTIDVLGILEEKTNGNLNEAEEKLLKDILHTLRLQFVEAKK